MVIRRQSNSHLHLTCSVLVALASFVCLAVYLAFARESLAPSGASDSTDLLFSWEIPGFAYMSNQVLMHVTAPLYHPFPNRKIVSPGIWFPKIQGVDVSQLVLPLEDVYELTPELADVFVLPTPLNQTYAQVDNLRLVNQEPYKNKLAVKVLSQREDYWTYLFTRYVVLGTIFQPEHFVEKKRILQFREPIKSILRNATRAQDGRIKNAIAVHVRTFEKSVTFNIPDVCAKIPVYHPLKHWYECHNNFDIMTSNIDSIQTSPTQPIYIATDDKHHEVVVQLQERYGERVFFMDDLIDWSAVDFGDTKIPHKAIPAFVENELLAEGQLLIGNFWSTFTTVAGIKKGEGVYYFVNKRRQAVSALVVLGSSVTVVFAIHKLLGHLRGEYSYDKLLDKDLL
jgi:hypothetical protein